MNLFDINSVIKTAKKNIPIVQGYVKDYVKAKGTDVKPAQLKPVSFTQPVKTKGAVSIGGVQMKKELEKKSFLPPQLPGVKVGRKKLEYDSVPFHTAIGQMTPKILKKGASFMESAGEMLKENVRQKGVMGSILPAYTQRPVRPEAAGDYAKTLKGKLQNLDVKSRRMAEGMIDGVFKTSAEALNAFAEDRKFDAAMSALMGAFAMHPATALNMNIFNAFLATDTGHTLLGKPLEKLAEISDKALIKSGYDNLILKSNLSDSWKYELITGPRHVLNLAPLIILHKTAKALTTRKIYTLPPEFRGGSLEKYFKSKGMPMEARVPRDWVVELKKGVIKEVGAFKEVLKTKNLDMISDFLTRKLPGAGTLEGFYGEPVKKPKAPEVLKPEVPAKTKLEKTLTDALNKMAEKEVLPKVKISKKAKPKTKYEIAAKAAPDGRLSFTVLDSKTKAPVREFTPAKYKDPKKAAIEFTLKIPAEKSVLPKPVKPEPVKAPETKTFPTEKEFKSMDKGSQLYETYKWLAPSKRIAFERSLSKSDRFLMKQKELDNIQNLQAEAYARRAERPTGKKETKVVEAIEKLKKERQEKIDRITAYDAAKAKEAGSSLQDVKVRSRLSPEIIAEQTRLENIVESLRGKGKPNEYIEAQQNLHDFLRGKYAIARGVKPSYTGEAVFKDKVTKSNIEMAEQMKIIIKEPASLGETKKTKILKTAKDKALETFDAAPIKDPVKKKKMKKDLEKQMDEDIKMSKEMEEAAAKTSNKEAKTEADKMKQNLEDVIEPSQKAKTFHEELKGRRGEPQFPSDSKGRIQTITEGFLDYIEGRNFLSLFKWIGLERGKFAADKMYVKAYEGYKQGLNSAIPKVAEKINNLKEVYKDYHGIKKDSQIDLRHFKETFDIIGEFLLGQDLLRRKNTGQKVVRGMSLKEVEQFAAETKQDFMKNPAAKALWKTVERNRMEMLNNLEASGWPVSDALKKSFMYFPHQVMDAAKQIMYSRISRKKHIPSHLRKAKGSEAEINLNFLEVIEDMYLASEFAAVRMKFFNEVKNNVSIKSNVSGKAVDPGSLKSIPEGFMRVILDPMKFLSKKGVMEKTAGQKGRQGLDIEDFIEVPESMPKKQEILMKKQSGSHFEKYLNNPEIVTNAFRYVTGIFKITAISQSLTKYITRNMWSDMVAGASFSGHPIKYLANYRAMGAQLMDYFSKGIIGPDIKAMLDAGGYGSGFFGDVSVKKTMNLPSVQIYKKAVYKSTLTEKVLDKPKKLLNYSVMAQELLARMTLAKTIGKGNRITLESWQEANYQIVAYNSFTEWRRKADALFPFRFSWMMEMPKQIALRLLEGAGLREVQRTWKIGKGEKLITEKTGGRVGILSPENRVQLRSGISTAAILGGLEILRHIANNYAGDKDLDGMDYKEIAMQSLKKDFRDLSRKEIDSMIRLGQISDIRMYVPDRYKMPIWSGEKPLMTSGGGVILSTLDEPTSSYDWMIGLFLAAKHGQLEKYIGEAISPVLKGPAEAGVKMGIKGNDMYSPRAKMEIPGYTELLKDNPEAAELYARTAIAMLHTGKSILPIGNVYDRFRLRTESDYVKNNMDKFMAQLSVFAPYYILDVPRLQRALDEALAGGPEQKRQEALTGVHKAKIDKDIQELFIKFVKEPYRNRMSEREFLTGGQKIGMRSVEGPKERQLMQEAFDWADTQDMQTKARIVELLRNTYKSGFEKAFRIAETEPKFRTIYENYRKAKENMGANPVQYKYAKDIFEDHMADLMTGNAQRLLGLAMFGMPDTGDMLRDAIATLKKESIDPSRFEDIEKDIYRMKMFNTEGKPVQDLAAMYDIIKGIALSGQGTQKKYEGEAYGLISLDDALDARKKFEEKSMPKPEVRSHLPGVYRPSGALSYKLAKQKPKKKINLEPISYFGVKTPYDY
jgi:hypothetical protein